MPNCIKVNICVSHRQCLRVIGIRSDLYIIVNIFNHLSVVLFCATKYIYMFYNFWHWHWNSTGFIWMKVSSLTTTQIDNFQCSQWWKFHQNDDIFVSVWDDVGSWNLSSWHPGSCLNIKMSFYQYRDLHVKDKTGLVTVSSLTWESPYLGKTVFILRQALFIIL